MTLTQLQTSVDQRAESVRVGDDDVEDHNRSIAGLEKALQSHYHDLMDILLQSGINIHNVDKYDLYRWVIELGFANFWRGGSFGADIDTRCDELINALQALDKDADLEECYTIYKGTTDLQPLKDFLIDYNVMSPEEIKNYEKSNI